MAKKHGFFAEMQREAERRRVQAERAERAAARDAERRQRERLKAAAANERDAKRRYAEARQREVDGLNSGLGRRVAELEGLLAATLDVDDHIDLGTLRKPWVQPAFAPGDLGQAEPEPVLETPPPLGGLKSALPGARRKYEALVQQARQDHAAAVEARGGRERDREHKLETAREAHEAHVALSRAQHDAADAAVDQFIEGVAARDPGALAEYFGLVLSSSRYPDGFPRWHRLAYVPESRQLVVEIELPRAGVVPAEKVFRYVKARDEVTSTAAPATERKRRYAETLAQVTLRSVHELFEADRDGAVDTVVLNGIVDSMDPRTGRPIRPCLITLRTTRETFEAVDLGHVDPHACLRHLNAAVSKSPTELAAVRPVLEFDMVDSRFVEESDVLGGLDQRPNLMDLTPGEFEFLITNLFERIGLQTRQTQASRDGGVDCVAYNLDPILGGKVVIQAKRYKNTVGVSAVRDLYGTMQNEGASKGILVTTSGYGTASYQFAEGKPLELFDGANLLHLLREHAGVEARIEPPEDWIDPAPPS